MLTTFGTYYKIMVDRNYFSPFKTYKYIVCINKEEKLIEIVTYRLTTTAAGELTLTANPRG